jgi:cytosine/adenosine deaminase-related metal-dependent hydrolase
MIIRARIVVTMDGAPIENGAVSISENRIGDVGSFDKVKTRNTGDTIDLGEQILLPGLINAHCHLDYTSLRGKIPPQKSFTEWIRAINEQKTRLSPNDYIASISDGFAEAKRFGTTAIANLTAFPELVSKVQPPIRTWWFPELIDIRTPERANELVGAAIESLGTARPQLARRDEGVLWGLAPHALFTASKNVFRRCQEIAEQKHRLLTTHLAESREEMEMFRDGSTNSSRGSGDP